MKAVDTHCHLQMAQFEEDREEVVARSLQALEWLVVIGDGIEGSEEACALCRSGIYASVGFHPYRASAFDEEAREALKALALRPGVIALGEMGLDYYNEFSPRDDQRRCFEQQLALAAELQMPVVIHCREADSDTGAILREHMPQLSACIMHCFGGTPAFAEDCLSLGCYISFAGNVTFPKAQSLREAALLTPMDRLLAETDAPYLAPQPFRGKRCEPAHVISTLSFLAELKGLPAEELIAREVENATRAYRLS